MGKLASNRVADTDASQLMSGYRRPQFVGANKILPIVDVVLEAGKFMEFAADASVIRTNLNRALGDARHRIEMRVGSGSYATGEVSIEVPLYDRELRNVPAARQDAYREKKTYLGQDAQLLLMEYSVMQVLVTAGNYRSNNTVTLAGAQQWKETTATPIKNLRDWLWTIALSNGIDLKDLSVAIAPKPWRALIDHSVITDRLKHVGKELTPEILASLLGCKSVELLSGMYASSFNPDDPRDVTFTNLYDDEVIVFHEIPKPTVGDPLPGCIARVEGYPIVTMYRDETKTADITAIDENWGISFNAQNRRVFLAKAVSGLPALV